MPSTTEKQARTMAAAAHSPKFAKKVGVPQKVARDFNAADAGTPLLKRANNRVKKRGKSGKAKSTALRGALRGTY